MSNSTVKRGRGRPKKIMSGPEIDTKVLISGPIISNTLGKNQTVQDLKEAVVKLEKTVKEQKDPYLELRELAEIIRIVQRAVKGLDPNDDIFQGLINVKDIRERTRLDETALLSHSAMRTASNLWPMLGFFDKIADMEDPYYISLDGEGRKEGILLQQAKTGTDKANLVLNMPNTQGQPAQDQTQLGTAPPKKRSIIDKVLNRNK